MHGDPVSTFVLRKVQRFIGVFQNLCRSLRLSDKYGDPDAGGDLVLRLAQHDGGI